MEAAIDADRKAHGKKPLKPKKDPPQSKEIKVSTSDPDSGYMVRDGKPEKGFSIWITAPSTVATT